MIYPNLKPIYGKISGTTQVLLTPTPPLTTVLRYQEADMSIVSIPLSQGKTAIIDAEDEALVSQYKWYAHRTKYAWYAVAYIHIGPSRYRTIRMHRLIAGDVPGMKIDHKNHDGLDNRRENLRVCTNGENMRNRSGLPKQNTSGYLGVWFEKRRNHWIAEVFDNGRKIGLGSFPTAEAAARARDNAARALYGEFVTLNFPDELEVDGLSIDAKTLLEPKGARRKRVDPEVARSLILTELRRGRYLKLVELYGLFSGQIRKKVLYAVLADLEQQGLVSVSKMQPTIGRPAVVWKAIT